MNDGNHITIIYWNGYYTIKKSQLRSIKKVYKIGEILRKSLRDKILHHSSSNSGIIIASFDIMMRLRNQYLFDLTHHILLIMLLFICDVLEGL